MIVCPTPIGNLEDVTLRVLRALTEADVVACEDTRITSRLLARHGIKARLVSYHEHNEKRRAAELVERIKQGQGVALVSDAGMPALADPGAILIRACLDAGLSVEVLPGPSAVTTAVAACGLELGSWRFVGFLPRRVGDLRRLLEDGAYDALVAFESPSRLQRTLDAIAGLDAERPVAVCREMTKVHEEVVRGSADQVADRFRQAAAPRGEAVVVVGSSGRVPSPGEAVDSRWIEALETLVDAGARPKEAAKVLAVLSPAKLSANRLYKAWLQRK